MGSRFSEPEKIEDARGRSPSENAEASQGPLTKRQVFLVQDSWSLVALDAVNHGLTFYERWET